MSAPCLARDTAVTISSIPLHFSPGGLHADDSEVNGRFFNRPGGYLPEGQSSLYGVPLSICPPGTPRPAARSLSSRWLRRARVRAAPGPTPNPGAAATTALALLHSAPAAGKRAHETLTHQSTDADSRHFHVRDARLVQLSHCAAAFGRYRVRDSCLCRARLAGPLK